MKRLITDKAVPPYFYILIRSRNSFSNFDKCIDSVLGQTYKNYKILFIDDASRFSQKRRSYIKKRLTGHVAHFNKTRRHSLFNGCYLINKYAKKENGIVFNLDGDDWLLNTNSLSVVAEAYLQNPRWLLTYGECLLWNGVSESARPSRTILSDVNINYSKMTIKNNAYRKELFLPLHPRTWKVGLFKLIKSTDFLDSRGKWLRFAEDQAMFFPMLEMAHGRYGVIDKPVYVYNIDNPHSDLNNNLIDLLKDELTIRRKKAYGPIQ